MPSTYVKAEKVVDDLAKEIIEQHHKDLDTVGVKIDILMVFRDPEGEAPAMSHRGRRALGLASIHPLRLRALGLGDCLVQLDGDAWPHMGDRARMALLDHEITHFEVKRDKNGEILWDDLDRPILKLRLHDWEVGWFHSVADRYGIDSHEVKDFLALKGEHEQTYFAWLEDRTKGARKLTPKQEGGEES